MPCSALPLTPSCSVSSPAGPSPPGRTLRLLGLLLALGRRLLLLALRDGLLARGLAGLGSLRATVFDEFEGSADDASLLLYGAAGALFGGFLWMGWGG